MTALLMATGVVAHVVAGLTGLIFWKTKDCDVAGSAGRFFLVGLFGVVYFWARVGGLE